MTSPHIYLRFINDCNLNHWSCQTSLYNFVIDKSWVKHKLLTCHHRLLSPFYRWILLFSSFAWFSATIHSQLARRYVRTKFVTQLKHLAKPTHTADRGINKHLTLDKNRLLFHYQWIAIFYVWYTLLKMYLVLRITLRIDGWMIK